MVLQLEDCIDVMKSVYPDFELVFLFDHSNGHDRLQLDGLSISKTRKNFGGSQPIMRNSKITEKDKNYGPYINSFPNTLSIGDTQTMYFKPTDPGPFHMSPSEAESRKHDRRTGRMRKKNIIKKDLIIKLKEMEISDLINDRADWLSAVTDSMIAARHISMTTYCLVTA